MARAKQLDQITGNIGKLSFYTRKGSDEIFVRTKGGATKDQIKRRPEFANVRKNNKEFGGCSKMSKAIRMAFFGLHHVADFNLAPALCSLMKNIQAADTQGEHGERGIYLSKHRQYVAGFNFNRINRFDSVLRIPLDWKIDRENAAATISIPAFACSLGLNMPDRYSLFRISATLGVVTDISMDTQKHDYEPVHDTIGLNRQFLSTDWFPRTATVATQQLNFQLDINHPEITFNDSDTLILSVAIEFGELDAFGNPTPVKGGGAGKVLGVR
jgi:hypothetical protein